MTRDNKTHPSCPRCNGTGVVIYTILSIIKGIAEEGEKCDCILRYYEPEKEAIEITVQEAINYSRAQCIKVYGKDLYPNDKEAVLDFVSNNWCF